MNLLKLAKTFTKKCLNPVKTSLLSRNPKIKDEVRTIERRVILEPVVFASKTHFSRKCWSSLEWDGGSNFKSSGCAFSMIPESRSTRTTYLDV